MALRVPKAELTPELRENMIKHFGAVAEPVEVLWHNPEVAQAGLEFGAKVGALDAADESLKLSRTWPSRHRLAAAGASTSTTFRRRTTTWTWPRRARCRAGGSRSCSRRW